MNGITFNEFKWELMGEVKNRLGALKWELYLANDNGGEECNCLVVEHRNSGWYMKFFLEEMYEEYANGEYTIGEDEDSIAACLTATAEENGIIKAA